MYRKACKLHYHENDLSSSHYVLRSYLIFFSLSGVFSESVSSLGFISKSSCCLHSLLIYNTFDYFISFSTSSQNALTFFKFHSKLHKNIIYSRSVPKFCGSHFTLIIPVFHVTSCMNVWGFCIQLLLYGWCAQLSRVGCL